VEDFRQEQGKPWKQFGFFELAPPFGNYNAGLKSFRNISVCFPRLSIQKPNGPHACLQVLANLEHQVVRLVMLGNDFNDQIGGNQQRYLVKIDVSNPLATNEDQVRSADRVFGKLHIDFIQDLPQVVFLNPHAQPSVQVTADNIMHGHWGRSHDELSSIEFVPHADGFIQGAVLSNGQ
jgi:hypothetical protein